MDNQENNENSSVIPEEINVRSENSTNEQTNQENTVTTEFKSTNQTVIETRVYSTNSNYQKITKTVISSSNRSSSHKLLRRSNSNMNALEVLNSESQELDEFKDNQDNNQDNTIMDQSNIPSSIVEIKRTPKSQSRASHSQGSAIMRPLDNHDITESNDNSVNTEPQKDSFEDRKDENKINDNNDFTTTIKSSNSQQEIVRRSQSIPNMKRENELTMTGTAAKTLNKSKSAQVSYKQSDILGSLAEVLHNNTNENNLETIKNDSSDNNKNNINNNNDSSIIIDNNENKNDDEKNDLETEDKTKKGMTSRRSNSLMNNPQRILGSLDTNLVDNSYQYKNTSGSRKSTVNNSQSSSKKNSRRNSRTGSSKRISSRGSTNSINRREKDNSLRTQNSFMDVTNNKKNYKDKIILYNTNKNRIAYMVTNKENKDEYRPVIIQSSNIFDINIDDKSNIHEVSVKIEQNQDTKDFIKSLDNQINKNLCYTDYFDIKRGNQYGSCSVQIREATYLSVPCYYIAKKVLVKDKTNDAIVNHLEFVSYVTPKLVTLHQSLLQRKDGGPSYNQHVDYNKKDKLIAIEQYYYKSDSSIKQLFDCDQYLSEGAIEVMNRILIEKEVKPHTYNFLTFVKGIMYQINTTTYPGIENARFQGEKLPYSVIKIENEILPRADHVNIYEEVDAIRILSDYQELVKENEQINESSNTFINDREEESLNSNINKLNNKNNENTTVSKVDQENLIKNKNSNYTKYPPLDGKEKSIHSSTDNLHKNDINEFEENNDGIMLGDLNVPNFTISNSQNNLTFEQLVKNNISGSNKLYNSNFDVNSSIGSCNLVEITKNISGSGNIINVDEINMKKGAIPTRKLKKDDKKDKKDDDVTSRYNNIETKICCPKRGCLIFDDELNQLHCENKIKYNDTIKVKSFLDEQENLSIYHEYKNTYTKKYLRYIKYNESLKFMLQDFVQSIFFHKPKDVYQFTKNYFSNE